MTDQDPRGETDEPDVPEAPATWENVVVGKIKEVSGELLGNKELEQSGEEQEETAHEVREEYREERQEHRRDQHRAD